MHRQRAHHRDGREDAGDDIDDVLPTNLDIVAPDELLNLALVRLLIVRGGGGGGRGGRGRVREVASDTRDKPVAWYTGRKEWW